MRPRRTDTGVRLGTFDGRAMASPPTNREFGPHKGPAGVCDRTRPGPPDGDDIKTTTNWQRRMGRSRLRNGNRPHLQEQGCGRHTNRASVADRPPAVDCGIGCAVPARAPRSESLRGYPWRELAKCGRDTNRVVEGIHEFPSGLGSADAREQVLRDIEFLAGRNRVASPVRVRGACSVDKMSDHPWDTRPRVALTWGVAALGQWVCPCHPASGTDRAPAAIAVTNALLIMFDPPFLSSRNDGEPLGRVPQWESSLARGASGSVARYCNLARFRRSIT
jgi:hypothetical protein